MPPVVRHAKCRCVTTPSSASEGFYRGLKARLLVLRRQAPQQKEVVQCQETTPPGRAPLSVPQFDE